MATIAFSHIGNIREENEDNYYYNEFEDLYIIADGIGGHQNGKEASRLAIKAFLHIYEQYKNDDPIQLLKSCFKFANQKVYEYQNTHFPSGIVGTTLTVALIRKNKLYLCHVGDSRAYLKVENSAHFEQITEDHTYFAELAKYDEKVKESLAIRNNVDKKDFLLKAIGPEIEVSPQIDEFSLSNNYYLVLATDGLYRYVSIDELDSYLDENTNFSLLAETMNHFALQRGGKDNITMILHCREEGDGYEPKIRGTI